MITRLCLLVILFPLAACTPGAPIAAPTATPAPLPTPTPEVSGMIIETIGANTPIHDPTLIKAGDMYYVFSTGPGISIHCSQDMQQWAACGRVFDDNPEWVVQAIPGVKDLWAPEIVYYGGTYYLYYSASTFGSNRSAIGLVTNTTLDPESPDYAWADQGEVIASAQSSNFNAIDPNLAFDKDGQPWLAFGSFWSGIKLVKVDAATLKPAAGEELSGLAAKPGSDAVEAAFITRRGDFYYLFISHDFCCRGVLSTYNIRVGRSTSITGPYVDRDGKPLAEGGGTVVRKGADRWRGTGHNAIYIEDGTYYLVYHAYDANASGAPTLRIEQLSWDAEGWPIAPGASLVHRERPDAAGY